MESVSEAWFERSCLLTTTCHSLECPDDRLPPFGGGYSPTVYTVLSVRIHRLTGTDYESD